ncbi:MAG: prepilin peptidase [Thermodesulfobacteriota bacterium]
MLIDILVFLVGLCLGSFVNVVIYRLPRPDLSVCRPLRSLCPSCRTQIAWYDNLPLISYILLLGRCRHCRSPISLRYPLVELICGGLTLAVFLKTGLTVRFAAELYLVLALVAVTYIDLDEMIIPDAITLPGLIIALAAAVVAPDLKLIGPWLGGKVMVWGVTNYRWLSLIGSVSGLILGGGTIWVIFQAYYLWRKEEGIGGGDFTLLAMIGAFLGWRAVPLTIFWGSFLALAAAVAVAVREGGFQARMKMPFGPFLSLAALIYLFFGERILRWYLGPG